MQEALIEALLPSHVEVSAVCAGCSVSSSSSQGGDDFWRLLTEGPFELHEDESGQAMRTAIDLAGLKSYLLEQLAGLLKPVPARQLRLNSKPTRPCDEAWQLLKDKGSTRHKNKSGQLADACLKQLGAGSALDLADLTQDEVAELAELLKPAPAD